MTRNTPCIKHDDYQHYFELLSQTVEDLNSFPPEGDIYSLIAVTVRQIAPKDAIILVNSLNPDTNTLTLHAVEGLGAQQPDVEATLGRPLKGLTFSIPEQVLPFMHTGECNEIPGGIAELSFGCISNETCKKIEAMPFFGTVYSAGISWKGKLKGAATFILPPKTVFENRDLITFFIRQVAGFLSRIEAETALKNNLAELTRTEGELRESEEKYRILAESAKDIIFIVNRDRTISYVNSAMQSSFGISPRDAVGKNINQVFSHDIAELQNSSLEQVFTNGEPAVIEMDIAALNGRVWFNTQLVPLFNPRHEVDQVLGISRDITSRKETEKKLIESEERLRLALSAAEIGVWSWNLVTTVQTHTNSGLLFGYTRTELEDYFRHLDTNSHPDDTVIDAVMKNIITASLCGNGTAYEFERRIRAKDGTWRWAHVQGKVVAYDSTGKPLVLMGTIWDITERKRADEALRESENKFATVFKSSPVALTLVSATEGTFGDVNDAFLRNTGYSRDEVIGVTSDTLGIFTDKNERERLLSSLMNHRCVYGMEMKCRTKTGEIRTCLFSSVFTQIREKPYILSTIEDITERKQVELALRESETQLRATLESTADGILAVDNKGKVLQFNRRFIELWQIPQSLIDRRDDRELLDFVLDQLMDPAVFLNKVQSLYNSNAVDMDTLFFKDGRVYERYSFPMIMDGEGIGRVWSFRDVTARKRAEEELAESEKKYRDIFENSIMGIFQTTPDGRLINANDALAHMFGYSGVADLLNANINVGRQLYANPEDRESVLHILGEKGMVESLESHYIRKDGVLFWGAVTARVIRDPGGCIHFYEGTIIDITERKRAEDALKESEERFRNILYTMPVGVVIIDAQTHTILDANDKALEIIEGKKEVVIGSVCHRFICPAELGKCPVTDLKQTVDVSERLLLTQNGEKKPILKSVITTTQGGKKVLIESFIDITERKRAEDALQQANKKLNLLSSITRHDINNQLTVLMGYLAILKKKQPDPAFIEYFQKASTAAQRIASMIQFTKEYESIGVAAPLWQDCHTLIETAAKQAPLGKITVKNDLNPGAEVFADPLIVKVFYNLMDNAVRYGGKITTIRFSVEVREGNHTMVCEDDGDGVVAGEKEKIFERGFGKNTGLGLALAREILGITGITIRETGEPGKGARFEMKVPKGAWRFKDMQ